MEPKKYVKVNVNKQEKSILLSTNFDYHFFNFEKDPLDYFTLYWVLNPLEKVTRPLFVTDMGGKSNYPKDIKSVIIISKKSVLLNYV